MRVRRVKPVPPHPFFSFFSFLFFLIRLLLFCLVRFLSLLLSLASENQRNSGGWYENSVLILRSHEEESVVCQGITPAPSLNSTVSWMLLKLASATTNELRTSKQNKHAYFFNFHSLAHIHIVTFCRCVYFLSTCLGLSH